MLLVEIITQNKNPDSMFCSSFLWKSECKLEQANKIKNKTFKKVVIEFVQNSWNRTS